MIGARRYDGLDEYSMQLAITRGCTASHPRPQRRLLQHVAGHRAERADRPGPLAEHGKADIISMARTLFPDPHFPNKVRDGKFDDIWPCIACTQSCVGHIYLGLLVGCIYNPVTGREEQWGQSSPSKARAHYFYFVIQDGANRGQAGSLARSAYNGWRDSRRQRRHLILPVALG